MIPFVSMGSATDLPPQHLLYLQLMLMLPLPLPRPVFRCRDRGHHLLACHDLQGRRCRGRGRPRLNKLRLGQHARQAVALSVKLKSHNGISTVMPGFVISLDTGFGDGGSRLE